jgi:hypothetical protein
MLWLLQVSIVVVVWAIAWPASAQPAPSANTRQAAWDLGSQLGLAAVGYAGGAPEASVASVLASAKALAAAIPVDVPALPAKTGDKAQASAAAIQYLIKQAGEPIGKTLREKHDLAHAALFEMAAKSQLLLMLYAPGDSLGQSLVTVIKRNAPRASLPENLWMPVADKVQAGAPFSEVKAAVAQMHTDVSKHLAATP